MDAYLNLWFSVGSIAFPLVVLLLKFKRISAVYYPFALLILAGFCTELIAFYLGRKYGTNMDALNFFSLAESVLLVYQFHRWGFLAGQRKQQFYILVAVMLTGWFVQNFVFGSLSDPNRVYLISYYFLLVMLGIRQINNDMTKGQSTRDELARLIICTGIILFFTFGIIRETFTIFASLLSAELKDRIFLIVIVTNLISNIIYGFGALYIPKKKEWPDLFRKQVS